MKTGTTNQWVATYYSALVEAWHNPEFKKKLLEKPEEALKERFKFVPAPTIEIRFKEVHNGDFSSLPNFEISVFDAPPATKTTFTVPLVPPPGEFKHEVKYLTSLHSSINCACVCG